jgi:monofunctional biosynthetic peptidoglycan transglycosylase
MTAKKKSNKKFSIRKTLKTLVTVSLFIQLTFIIYFYFRVSQHVPDRGRTTLKLIIAVVVIITVLWIYFKWLQRYNFIKRIATACFRFILYAHLFLLLYIIILKWINPPVTITQLVSFVSGKGLKKDHVNFGNISYNAKLAVIAGEDQLFPDHNGFDWNAVERSFNPLRRKKGRKRKIPPGAGASTISQQAAKNVFLWQGKSYFRKGLEAYFTFMIENIWGKRRILDVYLNCIEMGKGIFGIEAAAQTYFNKPALKLSRQEAAMIAACFPNPQLYTVKPLSRFVSYKSGWILGQMNNIEDDEDVHAIIK